MCVLQWFIEKSAKHIAVFQANNRKRQTVQPNNRVNAITVQANNRVSGILKETSKQLHEYLSQS